MTSMKTWKGSWGEMVKAYGQATWTASRNNSEPHSYHAEYKYKKRVGMADKTEPEKGKWYYRFDKGKNFKVTEVDEVKCSVTIQYLGGETDEITLPEWDKLELQKSE